MNENQWNGNPTVFKSYCRGYGKGGTKTELSFKDAARYPEFGGYLNMGFIDVSYDTPGESDAFYNMAIDNNWKCLILNNPTNEHIHSIWKLPENTKIKGGQNIRLAVGLNADVHLPVDKPVYVPFRVNGVDRFNNPSFYEPDEIQELPEELFPVESDITLYDLREGDGRNDAIYRSIGVLLSKVSFDIETIRRILTNTNNYLFREPLSNDELQRILRDASFQKPIFFNNGKLQFQVFGDYLIRNHHIISLPNDEKILMYKDGIYTQNEKAIKQLMLKEIPNLSSHNRDETLKYLKIMAPEKAMSKPNYIAFRNGIFDLVSDKLLSFDPEIVIPCMIPWDYNENAYDELCNTFLNRITCNDPDLRSRLEECIGYCFYRDNFLKAAFFLTGEKDNGKTTFLNLLQRALGEDNCSNLDMKQLSQQFAVVRLFGKLANVGDDISADDIKDPSFFKKVTGGGKTEAEYKGKDMFSFNPFVKFIFSANTLPRINDLTEAVYKRMKQIPFLATFSETDPDFDPLIGDKLNNQLSMEYFIKVGIDGLKRLIENKAFTQSTKAKEKEDEYREQNNPIEGFIEEKTKDYLLQEPKAIVYRAFQIWCSENGFTPVTSNVFSKLIKKKCDFREKDRQQRVEKGKPAVWFYAEKE